MIRNLPTLAILAVAVSACADPFAPEQNALDDARVRWEAAGITAYQLEYRNVCFCGRVHIRVDVTNGQVTRVEPLDDDDAFGPVHEGYTVERLFALIQDGLERRPHDVALSFHPELGYPTSVSFDPIGNAIDDEWGFRVENFVTVH